MALQLLPRLFYSQLCYTPAIPTEDLAGRTYVVTGANAGLGLAAARHLVRLGAATVVLACRDQAKGARAREAILADGVDPALGQEILVWPLDLCDAESIRSFVKQVAQLPRLDGVLANAGVIAWEFEAVNGDERTLLVNVLATFHLIFALLPALRASAAAHKITPTVTITSSFMHHLVPTFPEQHAPNTFRALNEPGTADMVNRYNVTKRLEILLANEFAVRHPFDPTTQPVIINTVNPGLCRSEFFRDFSGYRKWAMKAANPISRTSDVGSRTLLHGLLAGPASHGLYMDDTRIKHTPALDSSAEAIALRKKLWKDLAEVMEAREPGLMKDL